MADEILIDGKPASLDDIDIEKKFNAVKDAPAQDIPAPRRLTPEQREEVRARPRKTRTASKSTRTKTRAPARVSTPAVDQERAESVAETMNLVAAGAMMGYAANKDKNPELATAFAADAVVFSSQADAFGTACANLAKHSPGFAKMVDGGGKAGPWFAFGTAVYTIGAQIAANHGLIPGGLLGTSKPEDLAAIVTRQANEPQSV